MIGSTAINTLNAVTVTPAKLNANTGTAENTFSNYLTNALNSVNEKQMASDAIAQQLIVDPDSVDVHDVTIAMAQANLSLTLAQTVVDRLIKGWNEVTTTR